MTQKQKDLLIKDLCSRLPYGVKILVIDEVETLQGINILDNDVEYGSFLSTSIEEVKPYLFPMLSMTVKQRKEYDDLCEHILDDLGYPATFDTADSLDYLNKHNIDYRGLIPRGLALDATGKNIY